MTTICEEEVNKLRRIQKSSGLVGGAGGGAEERAGINVAVSSDVGTIFKGKTVSTDLNAPLGLLLPSYFKF